MSASTPADPLSWTPTRNVRTFLRYMAPPKVAARLKELREEAGLTQEDLAPKVGVRPRTISRWETGATGGLYDEAVLAKLAKALNVDPEAIIGPAPKTKPGQLDRIEAQLDRNLQVLLEIHAFLSEPGETREETPLQPGGLAQLLEAAPPIVRPRKPKQARRAAGE